MVSRSIETFIASSFSLATCLSSASGTEYTVFSSVVWFFTMYSAESAWLAKLMSMTDAGMPFGGGQVDQAALAQNIDAAAVAQRELLDELARRAARRRRFAQRFQIDLDVEVARVAEDRAVLHLVEVVLGDDVLVARQGDEEVADDGGFVHGHHAEAVHHGFQRLGRIDLGDDDVGAHAARPAGDAAAAPAVAGDHDRHAGQQHVRRADHAVERALAGAVAVVEQVLGERVVDGDDGIAQHAFLRHGAQADDAGGGFFGAADDAVEQVLALGMQQVHQVRAVVHRDVRLVIGRGGDVRIVRHRCSRP